MLFRLVHGRYYSLEWTWAYEMIERYYGVDLRSISAAEIIDLVRRWQECVIRLDEMLYEDARKGILLDFYDRFRCGWFQQRKSNRISRVFEEIS